MQLLSHIWVLWFICFYYFFLHIDLLFRLRFYNYWIALRMLKLIFHVMAKRCYWWWLFFYLLYKVSRLIYRHEISLLSLILYFWLCLYYLKVIRIVIFLLDCLLISIPRPIKILLNLIKILNISLRFHHANRIIKPRITRRCWIVPLSIRLVYLLSDLLSLLYLLRLLLVEEVGLGNVGGGVGLLGIGVVV
jgi:hypothetical protein